MTKKKRDLLLKTISRSSPFELITMRIILGDQSNSPVEGRKDVEEEEDNRWMDR